MKLKLFDLTKSSMPAKTPPTVTLDSAEKPSFGIRSYLHQFYHPAGADADQAENGWYLLPARSHDRKALYLCRMCTIMGLGLLLIGAAAIVVGYTWPKEPVENSLLKIELVKDENGAVWIPQNSMEELLRDPMRSWKLAGLGIFTAGGVLLAISLLVPTLAYCAGPGFVAELSGDCETPTEDPIKIFPTDPSAASEEPRSPVESKVPVMEEISKVQPEEKLSKKGRKVSGDELLLASDD